MSNFLLNLILNFDFSKSHPCKVKKWRSSEFHVWCSNEPHWLTDHKSEEKLKKNIEIWLRYSKQILFFFNENSQSLFKTGFLVTNQSIINVFFRFLFRFAISESIRFFWAIAHWILMIFILRLYKGGILKIRNLKSNKAKKFDNLNYINFPRKPKIDICT